MKNTVSVTVHAAFFCAAALLSFFLPADEKHDPELCTKIDAAVHGFMKQYDVPGLSLAFAHDGTAVFIKGYGVACKETGEKVTPEHRFRIASISKPVTSVAIMKLIEEGKLSLDDRVFGEEGILGQDYTSHSPETEEVTVRHLLTHTAGKVWSNRKDDPMFARPELSHHELIAWTLKKKPLARSPGTEYAYSNFGYCILGRVIEKITGSPYVRYVKKSILEPCGADGFALAGNTKEERKPNEAVYYSRNSTSAYTMQVTRMDSHGGWIARAEDLLQFALKTDGRTSPADILKKETILCMLKRTGPNKNYGFGWGVNTAGNWWHMGSLPGTASILASTSGGWSWAVLVNTRSREKEFTKALDRLPWKIARLFASKNLAPLATVTGGGKTARCVADGVKGTTGEGEWAPRTPRTWYGAISYPSVALAWETPQRINKMVLYDRPSDENHMAACELCFSDGTKEQVWAVPNDGTAKTVWFAPRTVTGVTLRVVDGVGGGIGLSEWEMYYDAVSRHEQEKKRSYTDFVSYVDPAIETGRGRWFFCVPGSRPFGMVSAAAHTRNKAQGGGGYNYNSTAVLGFSQIHNWVMAGISIMPTTGKVNPNKGEQGWKSLFSHATEIIEPGYHRLFLDRYQTSAEYTATERVAFYRFSYKKDAAAHLLVSLGGSLGPLSCVDGRARKVSAKRIEGSVGMTDRIWGGPRLSHAYFVLDIDRPVRRMDGWRGVEEKLPDITEFSNPVTKERLARSKRDFLFTNLPSEQAGVSLAYDVSAGDVVKVKIGISYTSIENARRNLEGECPHWKFDAVRAESRKIWNRWLGKIAVTGGDEKSRVKFYTDLWHVLLGRHKIDDLNGDYPSFMGSGRVRTVPKDAEGASRFHMYNSDAFWLTMWNLNILWGLAWPEVLDEFSASLIEYAEAGGKLPRGPGAGGYTGIMTGCPATSLITAAWQKGLLRKVDAEKAYKAMKRSHPQQIGFGGNSPGIAVQGAFEYWALSQMAEELGKRSDVLQFQKSIDRWKEYYNPEEKLLMAKGERNPFSGRGWVEANAWQGTFGVSHDIAGLSALMGGAAVLAEKLNEAFEKAAPDDFMFGYTRGTVSYANQPGCSGAHVFNHAGFPWLSQYWVRQVSRRAYGGANPNLGYGGHDEDQGQMGGVSALMKIGLFSLRGTCSKEPVYEITAPEFDEVTIQLDPYYNSGKTFKIKAYGDPAENCYIQRARLNGRPLRACWFSHRQFSAGGVLELWLGPEPNKKWGKSPAP